MQVGQGHVTRALHEMIHTFINSMLIPGIVVLIATGRRRRKPQETVKN
jgi:hypothetical protein